MHSTKSLIQSILSVALVVLCVSCGVSGGSSAASPSSSHSPSCDDTTQNYFSFTTDAASNYAENAFLGTAVYYKIYTSTSDIINHYNTIAAETTGAGGKSKLDSSGYQLLNGAEHIIEKSPASQTVEIRLFDETAYTKGIKINGTDSGIVPLRFLSSLSLGTRTFQFSSTVHPESNDGDFDGTVTSTGPWYVAAYAVSVVTSNGSDREYSKPKYLGYTKIYY